jgi:hypothetical protein
MPKTAQNLANLHDAISANSLPRIKNILEKNGKGLLNLKDHRGCAASHCAALKDVRREVVAFLVAEGASFDIPNNLGQTARSIASQRIKIFLSKPLETQKAEASLAVSRLVTARSTSKAAAEDSSRAIPKTSSAEVAAGVYLRESASMAVSRKKKVVTTRVAKPTIPPLGKRTEPIFSAPPVKEASQPKPVTKLRKSSATKVIKRKAVKPIIAKVLVDTVSAIEGEAHDQQQTNKPGFEDYKTLKLQRLRRDSSKEKIIKSFSDQVEENSAVIEEEVAVSLASSRLPHKDQSHFKQPANSLKPKAEAKAVRATDVTRPK